MARNKPSTFGVTKDLDFGTVQEVQEVKKEYGKTQGKKGLKLKRINMGFSDDNHDYITKESRKLGMSATAFVNMIIDLHRKG